MTDATILDGETAAAFEVPQMNDDQRKRVMSAIEELDAGAMSIEPLPNGNFEVKGKYEVDPLIPTCGCPDHEYRNHRCKHIMAVKLELFWGNVIPFEEPDRTAPPRPESLSPDYDMVPDALREYDQWVCWEQQIIENKDGTKRWTKVPIDVNGDGFASSTDPETWVSFGEAVEYDKREWSATDGIGIVVTEYDPLVGIDIDDCRDAETGILDESVQELLMDVETYAEVSPSGTGIRIFAFGEKVADGNQGDLPGEAHVEMYDTGRYLTVTGKHLAATGRDVTWDGETIRRFEEICEADD